jgi:hypothetical protein
MVESLLSFGRIEVGAYAWHLEPADTTQFVQGIVEEFRRAPEVWTVSSRATSRRAFL